MNNLKKILLIVATTTLASNIFCSTKTEQYAKDALNALKKDAQFKVTIDPDGLIKISTRASNQDLIGEHHIYSIILDLDPKTRNANAIIIEGTGRMSLKEFIKLPKMKQFSMAMILFQIKGEDLQGPFAKKLIERMKQTPDLQKNKTKKEVLGKKMLEPGFQDIKIKFN